MNYVVSYDLDNQKDYPKLEKKIAELCRVRAKVLVSQWLVESTGTAKEVANLILVGMDADDSILVTR